MAPPIKSKFTGSYARKVHQTIARGESIRCDHGPTGLVVVLDSQAKYEWPDGKKVVELIVWWSS